MKKEFKDKYTYTFSKDIKPNFYVEENEIFDVYTLDCFANQVEKEEDMPKIDFHHTNPATGPIYVNGVKPGDVLKVEILDIKVGRKGVICTVEGCGALWDTSSFRTKVFDVKDNKVKFNDLELNIDPMIGVIGLASEDVTIPTGCSYEYGGNMDCNLIKKGTICYFPVSVDGALLSLGDLHALMGDGEVCGTGIEIDGVVTVKVSIIKNFKLNFPLIETEDAYYVNTYGKSATDAIQKGYKEMQRLVTNAYNMDNTDATLYLSMQAIVSANQACLGEDIYDYPYDGPTFRVGVPKIKNKQLIK